MRLGFLRGFFYPKNSFPFADQVLAAPNSSLDFRRIASQVFGALARCFYLFLEFRAGLLGLRQFLCAFLVVHVPPGQISPLTVQDRQRRHQQQDQPKPTPVSVVHVPSQAARTRWYGYSPHPKGAA